MDPQSMPDLSNANLSDSIKEFFTKDELEKMCAYEQNHYKSIRKNYEVLKIIGLNAKKPEFMQRNKKHKPKQFIADVVDHASEAKSDQEWLPKRQKPGRHVLKSPLQTKSAAKTSPKMRKKENKADDCAEKDSDHEPHVYEFRKRRDINYMHVEVPDDDEFLYCEECNLDYPDDCPVHGPLQTVSDTPVLADDSDQNRALHTLPAGLEVRESGIPNAGLGVWATEFFPMRTRFGPYEGRRVIDPDVAYSSGYCWQLYNNGKPSHYVDAKDCSVSNWTRYVNCARTLTEQNLTAYQHRGQIFYRSHCSIQPGTELLVWYGADYGQELGITRSTTCRSLRRLGPDDGVFPCPHCKLAFSETVYLERHTNRKHGHLRDVSKTQVAHREQDRSTVSTRSCHFKENSLLSKTMMQTKSHSDDLNKSSEMCSESVAGWDSPDTNMTADTGYRPHGSRYFTQHCNMNADMNTASSERMYNTNTSGKTLTAASTLSTHRITHTGGRCYKCQTCDKTFTNNSDLNKHMRTHTGERPYKCKTCDKTFTQSSNLNKHMRTHTGERPYKCKTCDKTFTNNSHLNRHMRTHTGERPYQCKTCDKTFIHSSHLHTHMRTHTGERPYKCKTCDKTFTQSTDLNTHMRTHTGERPYKCQTCDKTYTNSSHLNTHMRTHTGERPYKCKTCHKTFTRSSHLLGHNKIHFE